MSAKTNEQLIDEASLIAYRINVTRFSGFEIEAEDTVRLVEILDLLTKQTEDA